MKAWIVFNEDLNKYHIFVEVDGDTMPLGKTIDTIGGVPIFKNSEFDSKEAALEFTKSKGKFELEDNWEFTSLFRCCICGSKMSHDSLGAEAGSDKEWLECECGYSRDLSIEELDYDSKMKYGN